VHEVANGAHIRDMGDGRVIIHDPLIGQVSALQSCNKSFAVSRKSPYEYDGWLAYTTYQHSSGIGKFLGYFSVPNNPQSDPQVLYLFTGLQNVDWIPIVDPTPEVFDIIQPVLQYPGDYGNYWSVKSWYVTLDGDVLYSSELQTKTGDNIFGNMTMVGGSTWFIGGTSASSGETTSLTVTKNRLLHQPWAYNTAECYGCAGGCNYEPTNSCKFTKLQIWDEQGNTLTPSWVPSGSPNDVCHEKATVIDPADVTLSFQ